MKRRENAEEKEKEKGKFFIVETMWKIRNRCQSPQWFDAYRRRCTSKAMNPTKRVRVVHVPRRELKHVHARVYHIVNCT